MSNGALTHSLTHSLITSDIFFLLSHKHGFRNERYIAVSGTINIPLIAFGISTVVDSIPSVESESSDSDFESKTQPPERWYILVGLHYVNSISMHATMNQNYTNSN